VLVAPLLELDPLGNVTCRLGCARGLAPRFHDVLAAPDGPAHSLAVSPGEGPVR